MSNFAPVKEIYDVKYAIRRNRGLIFSATVLGDWDEVRKLEREIDTLRNRILRKYAIIMD